MNSAPSLAHSAQLASQRQFLEQRPGLDALQRETLHDRTGGYAAFALGDGQCLLLESEGLSGRGGGFDGGAFAPTARGSCHPAGLDFSDGGVGRSLLLGGLSGAGRRLALTKVDAKQGREIVALELGSRA